MLAFIDQETHLTFRRSLWRRAAQHREFKAIRIPIAR
jgi:hypothetical protein